MGWAAFTMFIKLDMRDVFLFPKIRIHLKAKIWGCGRYQKKYDGAASPHIKRRGTLTNKKLSRMHAKCQGEYFEGKN